MTPKRRNYLLTAGACAGAILAVWALMGSAVAVVDKHYVLADTFTIYQQGQAKNRAIDSVIHLYELDKLKEMKADVDTIKHLLRRR